VLETRRVWFRLGVATAITLAVLAIAVGVVMRRAAPILKGRIVETLSTRFESRVELADLEVSVLRGLEVSGDRLKIYPPASVVAAGAKDPLIAIDHFSFHSGIIGLFFKPMHVRAVAVTGLAINIPPREMRQQAAPRKDRKNGKIKIVVDEIICDDSRLIIATSKPDKDPKNFELKHIEMHNVGPNAPWKYEATLTNAVPRGEIHSAGTFGPWQTENPGDSSVTGHYKFEHADLNTIKGIGGILQSVGDFKGQLDRIEIDGTATTPDFSLDTSNHPMPLSTRFHAIVDGTSGDTYLLPVDARLGESHFTTRGTVINIKGKGHRVALDVDVNDCRLQDFLALAVKTEPPVMTALIDMKSKLEIRPGTESVSQKLGLDGHFTLKKIHFTNPDVQDKVDMLSLRAQGKPEKAKSGATDVASQMHGRFILHAGVLQFSDLAFNLPGANVTLLGQYSLDGQKFEFHGRVLTKASISQMVDSWWKSLLLEPASLMFKKKGGGADIPVQISGTKGKPKFGIDVFNRMSGQKGEK
jgi:AsmA-like protein